ncbi:protein disulfide isomerase [Galdieria sulphuraria]|uniref:Protein disulfide isomerase n=1 Tax=Galdieria sulphuraria TaxID=130081 RepID=M2XCV3_GALSU|nr:protein disulfide isomerase [Galdieria sulphuraria]EME27787.1 protein disulfide isomerase [Galdieria sulphuraria]|eukprot:XP_005704307.1 protein disulfide isomerase [Galdieria sulphuraria]
MIHMDSLKTNKKTPTTVQEEKKERNHIKHKIPIRSRLSWWWLKIRRIDTEYFSWLLLSLLSIASILLLIYLASTVQNEPQIRMKNNSKVQVLDFDSYSSVVYSSDKDVVLFIFTTWCGHCLDFIPQYMELASNLSYIEDLTFAAIQPRDMPPIARKLDISSFPVFYLFLRGQKDSPIRFYEQTQGMTIQEFIFYQKQIFDDIAYSK